MGGTHHMAKVRLQALVEPEVADLFQQMSKATNKSVSVLVADLLLTLAPGLEQSLKMLKLAKQVQNNAQGKMTEHLEQTLKLMEAEIEKNKEVFEKMMQ